MLIKIGELSQISAHSIRSTESVLAEMGDDYINERFGKFASQLKKIAPKADEFLYFSAIMMHAAESSAINDDGSPKLTSKGEPVKVDWEISDKGSWKWVSSDPNLKPMKNANGDIFPEKELLKAYKKWTGKPLCVDHRSDQVDAVRGIILDTYYDHLNKRVIALCALDKVSFPELARGITAKYKTCVSMGTRVGKAICYDCGQIASTEREFCQHMTKKSGFGEINIDLDPIELSIVVTGADPRAKIRMVLAAANQLRNEVETKEHELNELSLNKDSRDKLKELEEDIKNIANKVSQLKESLEKEQENDIHELSRLNDDHSTMIEASIASSNINSELPITLANNNYTLVSEMQNLKDSVNSKFHEMEKSLVSLSHKLKEEIMSATSKDAMNKEGYFQGAGGVNEPTPHQAKYPIDPLNKQLRDHGDKNMTESHTGPVDQMFPGDKEKKALVQRAELEERAMRRAAALGKAKENLKAYWQGGGEGNEPKPGKQQYPVDPGNEKARKEDKQMVGKKPFPSVGDVDGLYPEDLKKKELLQRANKISGKFIRVANEDGSEDLAQSGWEIKRDNEVLFTATVDEISGGNVDSLYEVIASKDFGFKMLEKVAKLGAKKASELYKRAAEVEVMPTAPVPEMPDMSSMAPAPTAPANDHASVPQDTNADGDPKAVVLEIAKEMDARSNDLLEAARELNGEQVEMGELEGLSEKAASSDFGELVAMKRDINKGLMQEIKTAIADMNTQQEELSILTDIVDDKSLSSTDVASVTEQTIGDSREVLAKAYEIMGNFVNYVKGSKQLKKEAQAIEHALDQSSVEDLGMDDDSLMVEDQPEDMLKVDDEETQEDEDMNDVMMDVDPASLQGKKVEIKATAGMDLSTKEGRQAARAKLAAQAIEFSPMLDQSNALANGQTKLDVKPSGTLGKVETLEEKHQAMLDVAEAPVKVRKEAARLNEAIVGKKIAATDLDKLVSNGLDAEVVKYWKQFYGQAGKEGSEFATELLKEHAKAQIDQEIGKFKVKISRAYEITNEMVRRGLVADERAAITAQVENVMTWNDAGFESMKNVINKTPLRRTASIIPQVGLINCGESTVKVAELSLQDELDRAFSGRRH